MGTARFWKFTIVRSGCACHIGLFSCATSDQNVCSPAPRNVPKKSGNVLWKHSNSWWGRRTGWRRCSTSRLASPFLTNGTSTSNGSGT
eukprot:7930926-Alexandrium_andersonii.AAC.1